MFCYKDRSYCLTLTDNHTCGRELTERERLEADRLDMPIAGAYYCTPTPVGVSVDDNIASPTAVALQSEPVSVPESLYTRIENLVGDMPIEEHSEEDITALKKLTPAEIFELFDIDINFTKSEINLMFGEDDD